MQNSLTGLRRVNSSKRSRSGASSRSGTTTALRAKTLRIARLLESFLGTPTQSKHLPAPLDMLIATILSQNTNDKNSHRAYACLRKRFPAWESASRAHVRNLIAAIRVGGMANQKAVRIKETLAAVKARYGTYALSALYGKTNDEVLDELTRMKGVGSKTAACVLLFSLGRDVFPVDTHVHRICNRLGLVTRSGTPEKTFGLMKSLVPPGRGYSLHTNLIRFGRKICRAHLPQCDSCPLYHECTSDDQKMRSRSRRMHSAADHDFMTLDNV
jgi:endonuclease III